jgi:hypothetical protein
MAYSLRLPDALDAAARIKADYLGISINALICVALDAYLRVPGETAQAGTGPGIPQTGDRANPIPQMGDTKPKRFLVERKKAVDSDDLDPKPGLPDKPSKADRDRLAKWYLRHPAR